MKQFLIWTSLIVAAAFAIWNMTKLATTSNQATVAEAKEISESDWVKGSRAAKVVLVEYSDLQCAACAYYAQTVESLAQEFGDQIAIVYRHFPLPQHKNARLAAYAAEAAGRQGKFWEMINRIFLNQKEWASEENALSLFTDYAEKLNLNLEIFQTDLDSPNVKEVVENQYASGIRFKVNGTPTFFLNGEKISKPNELPDLIRQKLTNP